MVFKNMLKYFFLIILNGFGWFLSDLKTFKKWDKKMPPFEIF